MYAVKLAEPIKVFVPVLKAGIRITSDQADELSQFSQFIIFSLGIGEKFGEVERVTRLDPKVIKEEMAYLMKIGLLTSTANFTETDLTSHGRELFEVILTIDSFNEREEQVLINCVTGQLELYQEPIGDCKHNHFEQEEEIYLKEKIVRELYQNQSPFNSKEFLFEHYDFSGMNEGQKEDIQVALYYEQDTYYVEKEIAFIPSPGGHASDSDGQQLLDITDTLRQDDGESFVYISREPHEVKLDLELESLDKHRPVIDTLSKLRVFDHELISSKSIELLEAFERERAFKEKQNNFYYDPLTGQSFWESPLYPFEHEGKWLDISLSSYRQPLKLHTGLIADQEEIAVSDLKDLRLEHSIVGKRKSARGFHPVFS